MATITIALTAQLNAQLGSVPPQLASAISSLTAAQRDAWVTAWLYASDAQRQRTADQWVLPESDRLAFEKFRATMAMSS